MSNYFGKTLDELIKDNKKSYKNLPNKKKFVRKHRTQKNKSNLMEKSTK